MPFVGKGNLGFDLNEQHISCRFVPRNPQAKKTIAALKAIVQQVDTIILATDEDREGEAEWEQYIIGWNEDYFAPALEKAMRGMAAMPRTDKNTPKGNAIAQGKESKTLCPLPF